MILDSSSLDTQQDTVRIKSKWSKPEEKSGLALHLGVEAIEKGPTSLPSTTPAQLAYYFLAYIYIYIYIYEH